MRSETAKRRVGVALVALIIASFMCLYACDCGGAEKDARVKITSSGVTLTWEKIKDADSYEVYHSPSRYGEYKYEKTVKKPTFSHADSYGYFRIDAMKGEEKISSELMSYDIETFGENTHVYAPTDDMQTVQNEIDAAIETTFGGSNKGQFTDARFAALFKNGDYSDLDLTMGYYMSYAGLGNKPTDVTLGGFNVHAELSGGNATCNFWRGIENLTVDSSVKWAVSQATSFRRMQVNGNVQLTESSGSRPWGSGGFIADSKVTGTINAQNQQQWLTRNTEFNNWTRADINMVFAGCEGQIPSGAYSDSNRVTNLKETTVMKEKPFLTFDDVNGYGVAVPELVKNSRGVSWNGAAENISYYSLDGFYVARADKDTADTLNAALEKGKDILFTPGIYLIDKPLEVTAANSIIMGIGLATLKISGKNTDALMKIADEDGINVSGLIFDAGEYSENLVVVGGESKSGKSHADNPIVLSDVYFRIGGAKNEKTEVDCTLLINANDVVGDNFWVWRADHSHGVAWDMNITKNGVVVGGDNVTIYGLMVEHFHEYQTIWNGENGYMVFYQSETPYDVPDQTETSEEDKWTSVWNDVEYDGYASYKVGDSVNKHTAYGIGVYYVSRGNTFVIDHAVELPSNPGIHVEHMAIANFSTEVVGGIRSIVNGKGKSVIKEKDRPVTAQKVCFNSFIGGVYSEKA